MVSERTIFGKMEMKFEEIKEKMRLLVEKEMNTIFQQFRQSMAEEMQKEKEETRLRSEAINQDIKEEVHTDFERRGVDSSKPKDGPEKLTKMIICTYGEDYHLILGNPERPAKGESIGHSPLKSEKEEGAFCVKKKVSVISLLEEGEFGLTFLELFQLIFGAKRLNSMICLIDLFGLKIWAHKGGTKPMLCLEVMQPALNSASTTATLSLSGALLCLLVFLLHSSQFESVVASICLGSELLKVDVVNLKSGQLPISIATHEMSKHKTPTLIIFHAGSRLIDEKPLNLLAHHPIKVYSHLRRNLTHEVLHLSRVKLYFGSRRWGLSVFVHRLVDMAQSKSSVRLIDRFQYAMFCLLVYMYFGDKLLEKEIARVQRRIILAFCSFNVLNFWPLLGKILLRKRWMEIIQRRLDHEKVLISLIRARLLAKQVRRNIHNEDYARHELDQDDDVAAYVYTLGDLQLLEEHSRDVSWYKIDKDLSKGSRRVGFYIMGTSSSYAALIYFSAYNAKELRSTVSINQFQVKDVKWDTDLGNVLVHALSAGEFDVLAKGLSSVPRPTQGSVNHGKKQLITRYTPWTIFDSFHDNGFDFGDYFQNIPTTSFYINLRDLDYISKFHQFDLKFKKVAGNQKLPSLIEIEPRHVDLKGLLVNYDHPSHGIVNGQSLVKEVYEALGASQLNGTLLVITYDKHGGFCHHSQTSCIDVSNSDGHTDLSPCFFKFDRLSIHAPTLMVPLLIKDEMVTCKPTYPISEIEHSSTSANAKKIFTILSNFWTQKDAWAGTFEHVDSELTTRTYCHTS